MYYDVLINYCGLDSNKKQWSRMNEVGIFQRVLFLFKKEINSHEYFIYVRKVYNEKCTEPIFTNFKLITHTSYIFCHYPKISDYKNMYLVKKFNCVDFFADRNFLPGILRSF